MTLNFFKLRWILLVLYYGEKTLSIEKGSDIVECQNQLKPKT